MAPDIQDAPEAKEVNDVKGAIDFENVSFAYEGTQEKVLSHVKLKVKAGEYVALVGSSGAGKTTLCSLIPRFYDVTEGSVLLDGEDIRNLKLQSLRNQIGIVQQDVYLFAGTVMENIRYGKLTLQMKKSFAPQRQPMPMNLLRNWNRAMTRISDSGV